jgi:hypothetical protein
MMKPLFLILMMLLAVPVIAADVTFEWDYVQGLTPATGFEMRLSSSAGGAAIITQDCPSGTVFTCTVPVATKGTYYARCYAYAVDDVGKQYSGPSNEVVFQITGNPNSPINLRIKK